MDKRFIGNYYTIEDIMNGIEIVIEKHFNDINQTAKSFLMSANNSPYELCKMMHGMLNTQFKEVIDRAGEEIVLKSPKLVWDEREGNVKNISILFASVFKCLNIPFKYCLYRFPDTENHAYLFLKVSTEKGWIILNTQPGLPFDIHVKDHIKFTKSIKSGELRCGNCNTLILENGTELPKGSIKTYCSNCGSELIIMVQ